MQKKKLIKTGLQFFTSETGRKVVFGLATATTSGLVLANYVPHTFALDYYRSFMQCYRNGTPQPLSPKLIERLNEATKILDMKEEEKNLIKPFSVFGFELFSAGSIKSRFGGIIGIPFNYEVDNIEQLKSCNVCYSNKNIDWDSRSGKLLEESLILTKDEQIFGFCKHLLQLKSNYVLLNSIFPSASFLAVYTVGNYLNQSLNLFMRPFSLRFCMYAILGLFGVGSWSFMKDYNQVTYDADIDIKLSSISPDLMKAGLGFYEKQLKKNMALREIGKDNTFTTKGNFNYLLRQKSLPLTVRKSFFEQKYQEYMNRNMNELTTE